MNHFLRNTVTKKLKNLNNTKNSVKDNGKKKKKCVSDKNNSIKNKMKEMRIILDKTTKIKNIIITNKTNKIVSRTDTISKTKMLART